MKSERRHELKENDLAHVLSVMRDYLDKNGGRIGLLILIVFGSLAVITFTVRGRAAALEDVWRRRSELTFDDVEMGKQSLESLKAMTNEVSDNRFVMDSLIDYTRQALRLAMEAPDSPDSELNNMARSGLVELLDRFPDNPLAAGVALHGLATVEQNSFVIDFSLRHKENARKHLQQIIDTKFLHTTPFHQLAVSRISMLDDVFTEVKLESPPLPEPEKTEGENQENPDGEKIDPPSTDNP